jgi:hypothetical protein
MYKHYFTPLGFHKKTNEIITYDELLARISLICEYTGNTTIGDLNGRKSNPTTLLWVQIPKLGKFRVHADSKMKGLAQLLETGEPNVVISRRGSKVLSSLPKSIPGVYIYLEE